MYDDFDPFLQRLLMEEQEDFQSSKPKISTLEIVVMIVISFTIVFGCAGLYNQAAKEMQLVCQEGC